ncbi:protein catalytic domain protein [Nannochloropsis oceanica]
MEAAHDGVDRSSMEKKDEGSEEGREEGREELNKEKEWPLPARLTAKWSLSFPPPPEQGPFFSMHDLPPSLLSALDPVFHGAFGEGGKEGKREGGSGEGQQWTPLGVAMWARRAGGRKGGKERGAGVEMTG